MKRIWFKQQKQFDYIPLMAGLGYISLQELKAINVQREMEGDPLLCPKIYTTRTHRLNGEYYIDKRANRGRINT